MITLLILFTVIATSAVTISMVLSGLAAYLWRERKHGLRVIHELNNAVYSLSTEKAYLIGQQKQSPAWFNKGSETVH